MLSVDPRVYKTAYAYFQDSKLRDWRNKTFQSEGRSTRSRRLIIPYLVRLLDQFDPHALIVPETEPIGTRRRSCHTTEIVQALIKEARNRGIAVHVVSTDAVRKAFTEAGEPTANKDAIHREIIRLYPEFEGVLPRSREKLWQCERFFTPLFNAAAMYLAWRSQPSPMDIRRWFRAKA